ncbi:MAG: DNA gyrase inhibitor YacG [Rhodomicrobium sp.]|nr:DNA gyrase inhibitor YacG [Rhodomicrobium sp.]
MIADKASESSKRTIAQCPICSRPRVLAYRPFCSKRCADVDLGRWLNGNYFIEGTADAEEDGEPERKDKGDQTDKI